MSELRALAKAYYVWQSPTKAEIADKKKHIEYVHTHDGRDIPVDEWEDICLEMIAQADLSDLLREIEERCQRECLWVKQSELQRYAIGCLLNESYRKWEGFTYQERLML